MSDKLHGKMSGKSAKAFLLISCMLVCAMSPVITTWNDDSSVDADGVALNYVSLGDSMTNGFGMADYYIGTDNHYGFEVKSPNSLDTYPVRFAEYLTDEGFSVNHNALAVSGFRSAELRYLIDPGFSGDAYPITEGAGFINKCQSLLPDGYSKNLAGLREYYTDKIQDADIITYSFMYDFGYTLSNNIMGSLGMSTPLGNDFSLYMDADVLAAFENIKIEISEFVLDILTEQNIDVAPYQDIIDIAEGLVQSMIFSIVSYCSNFDANMERIFELNPDAKVIVIDSYSNIPGMTIPLENDMCVPVGDIVQFIMGIANLYAEYLSPWSCQTYHVDIDEDVTKFSDEFIYMEEGVTADTKALVLKFFDKYPAAAPDTAEAIYDAMDENNAISDLFKCIFSTTEFPIIEALTVGIDIGGAQTNFKSFVTGIATADTPVVIMNDDGDCELFDGDAPTGLIIDKFDLALLWVWFTNMAESGAIGHPNGAGHDIVYNALIETVECENVLYESVALEDLAMPLDPPASGEVGTLVSLVDTLGSMYTSPEFIAEALGLEVDYDAYLPMGFRADDIVYLLGGTDAKDAFTDDLMINNAADMGLSVEAFKALYQTAVANSSAVVVNAGSDNLIFAITQSIKIINDVETEPLDFTKFDSVDSEFYNDLMYILNEMYDVLEYLVGADSAALQNLVKVTKVIETIAYSTLGYVDNYAKIVEAIQALNPSTQIVVVGPYNLFDGFYFENAEPAFTIDIGAAFAPIIGGINSFNASQVAGMDNVTYVDMTDMYQATEKVNVADLAGMDTDTLLATILGSVSINEEGVLAQIQDITGSIAQVQYTIYFDINGDVQSKTYFFGEVIDVPDVVADVGTVFVGWDADVPATMPACDLYFTAEFEPLTYYIEFDANGGTGYMADMFAVYGDSVVLDANEFTYQGFNFAGWNTEADGTGVAYENGATVSNLCTVDGDVITLYAQWTAAPVPDVPENSDFDEATVTFVGYFILVLCIIAVIAGLVALKKE